MAQYAVTHVRLENDLVTHVKMGLWNLPTGDWATAPTDWPVIEVIDRILGGDNVTTLVEAEDGNWEQGPDVCVLTLSDGRETVACDPSEPASRQLQSLPSF
jgi:hypothetical protein